MLTSREHSLCVDMQALLVFKAWSMAQDGVHQMLKHGVDITLTSLYIDVQALLVFKALLTAQDEVHWVLKHHVDITLH